MKPEAGCNDTRAPQIPVSNFIYLLDTELEAKLEQARSTTRRNILGIIANNGSLLAGMPEQDATVACAAIHEVDRIRDRLGQHHVTARAYLDRETELLGTIKGRDKTIDRLCRHIAFQVAK